MPSSKSCCLDVKWERNVEKQTVIIVGLSHSFIKMYYYDIRKFIAHAQIEAHVTCLYLDL